MTTKNYTEDDEIMWQTVEKAAPHLQLSAQGLYAAVREKQLPPDAVLRIGRRIRINLAALPHWNPAKGRKGNNQR